MKARSLPVFTFDTVPDLPEMQWCVKGLLARGAATSIAGQPGVKKTVHAVYLATCVAAGLDFGTFHVPTETAVLYVSYDAPFQLVKPLFEAVADGLGCPDVPRNIHFFVPGSPHSCYQDGTVPPHNLADLGPWLVETVRELDIGLVIIDSLMQSISGDPLAASDITTVLSKGLTPVLHQDVAVLLIDHTTKAAVGAINVPTPIGTQAKRSWVRLSIIFETIVVDGKDSIRWTVDKSNFAHFSPFLTRVSFLNDEEEDQLQSITIEFESNAPSRTLQKVRETKHDAAKVAILEALSNSSHVMRKNFARGGTYDRAFKDLVESGEIHTSGNGEYSLGLESTTTPDTGE